MLNSKTSHLPVSPYFQKPRVRLLVVERHAFGCVVRIEIVASGAIESVHIIFLINL